MGCSPNICFKNNRLYLCPRRPCSLKWWHTAGHKCPVVCRTMLGCVQVGSVVWRVTRGYVHQKTSVARNETKYAGVYQRHYVMQISQHLPLEYNPIETFQTRIMSLFCMIRIVFWKYSHQERQKISETTLCYGHIENTDVQYKVKSSIIFPSTYQFGVN